MKTGHPVDRLMCAQFAKQQRARFPSLSGGWSYHEWCCHQVAQATANKLAHLTKARKAAERVPSLAEIDRIAIDEAREAAREHSALLRQVDANRRDPALSHLYD